VINWDAVGAVGEIVGAIAVVLTLVYLSRQIKANSAQLETGSVTDLAGLFNDAFMPVYNDEQSRGIWVRGLNDPESLSTEERAIFDLFMFRLFNPFEVVVSHYRKGVLDRETLEGYAKRIHGMILAYPGGQAWLDANRHLIDTGVLVHIERVGE